MGKLILKEKLRKTQWPSIILAFLAILILVVQSDLQHFPWIALTLSATFALYGLIRKMVHVGSLEGLAFETSVLILPVLIAWSFISTSPISHPRIDVDCLSKNR
jgi:chloramphenicol-sensitive protein RarD